MDTLSLRLFIRISQLKGVSAAARDLSLSPASASARIAKLEETLGFRLFNRTTRAVTLTTDGAAFLPYAQQSLETLETGLSAVSGQDAEAQGDLRITMPGSFGRMHILPRLAIFQQRHPKVHLDLRLSDEVLNVVEGAYDLIIRNASLADANMVARKLAADRRLLVAAPSYLQRHGIPTKPEDLAHHGCLILFDHHRWTFQNGQTINVPPTCTLNDGEALRILIESGMGIGVKSLWNAYEALNTGRLVEILPDYPLATESAIWALYPQSRVVTPKVRVMIDFLLEQFQPSPPWEEAPSQDDADD